ncbi:hypothetical protein N0V88_007114 [Collariella sp. IMI 366227]|nr:hypothetical protein N0V88_007114 [Collariella sp. IMI 366227]
MKHIVVDAMGVVGRDDGGPRSVEPNVKHLESQQRIRVDAEKVHENGLSQLEARQTEYSELGPMMIDRDNVSHFWNRWRDRGPRKAIIQYATSTVPVETKGESLERRERRQESGQTTLGSPLQMVSPVTT